MPDRSFGVSKWRGGAARHAIHGTLIAFSAMACGCVIPRTGLRTSEFTVLVPPAAQESLTPTVTYVNDGTAAAYGGSYVLAGRVVSGDWRFVRGVVMTDRQLEASTLDEADRARLRALAETPKFDLNNANHRLVDAKFVVDGEFRYQVITLELCWRSDQEASTGENLILRGRSIEVRGLDSAVRWPGGGVAVQSSVKVRGPLGTGPSMSNGFETWTPVRPVELRSPTTRPVGVHSGWVANPVRPTIEVRVEESRD